MDFIERVFNYFKRKTKFKDKCLKKTSRKSATLPSNNYNDSQIIGDNTTPLENQIQPVDIKETLAYNPPVEPEKEIPEIFVDQEFPPNPSSIFINGKASLIPREGLKKVSNWLRPQDITVDPEELSYPFTLVNNPDPRFIVQGHVGSCWLIAALVAISQRPDLLQNILFSQFYNPNGYHQIRLCIRGEWKIIDIDDYLPCDSNGKIVFSTAKFNELWVAFVEKAVAKVYGSYEAIAVGTCAEGLQNITGHACDVLLFESAYKNLSSSIVLSPTDNNNPHFIWQKLFYYKSYGYLMTALCHSTKDLIISNFQKDGLVNKHIYTVLDVREFESYGKTIRLIKLRNPLGKNKWKGPWSKNWSGWPSDVFAQLAPLEEKDDAAFWIAYEDVLRDFNNISVSKVRMDVLQSRNSSIFYNFYTGAEVFSLTVFQQGFFDIELFSTWRKYSRTERNRDPGVDLMLVICVPDESGSGLKCIAFKHDSKYFTALSLSLSAGYYIIYAISLQGARVFDNFHDSNYFTYNLVVHGQSNYNVNRYNLPPESISDMFCSLGVYKNQIKYEVNDNIRTYVVHTMCCYAIIVENLSSTNLAKINIDMSKSENFMTTRNDPVTNDILPPRTKQVINCLTPRDFKTGFKVKYKYNYELVYDENANNDPTIPHAFYGLHAIRDAASQKA